MSDTGKLVRAVGFWGLVAMCINAVVGAGVFLLPSESYKLLGPFSLWAPLIFALPVFILVLCFAEAASHFTEPGGAFLLLPLRLRLSRPGVTSMLTTFRLQPPDNHVHTRTRCLVSPSLRVKHSAA